MFKRLTHHLFSDPEEIGLENYFVQVISFLISIIGILGAIINIFLELGFVNIISTLITAAAFAGNYFICKNKQKYIISKNGLIFLSLIVINIQWTINFGTNGPILYLFVIVQSFVVILFTKWKRVFYTSIIILNVTVLFFIEFRYPDIFGSYSDNYARLIDLYSGMLIYLSLCIVLINIALSFYIREKEKAQRADKLKSSFLANMSHEIRTPMNAIIGFGELLNETKTKEEKREYLKIIHENGYHLLKLIDDIIDISIIEANQVKIVSEDFSAFDLLDSVYHVIQKYLENNNKQHLQFICNKPFENFIMHSDFTRIKQVLTNLLSNAVKFTEQGSIIFGCTPSNGSVTFYVQDTGIGIDKNNLENIFERFRKIENTVNDKIFRGTGIGLSISRQLVELMKGEIWVESEPGRGTKFSFEIPTEIIELNNNTTPKTKDLPDFKFSGELVLIAEDEDSNYTLLSKTLLKHEITTIRARNGIEAIELCKTVPEIRLVLMDIKMPKMNGIDAMIRIKMIFPGLPVIAQTAFAMKSDEKESMNAGFDDYISKPINPELLLEKIKSFLS